AGQSAHSACALCLGRFSHDVNACSSPTLWNGDRAYCSKDRDGYLITSRGAQVCLKWQLPRQCSSSSHPQRHICS
ncbi:hypothetical protein C8R46DRAFT_817233, partial [Mycena filopes]